MSTDNDDVPSRRELAERIHALEAQQQPQSPREFIDSLPTATRRGVITAALGALGISAATGEAMAQSTKENIACHWLGNQDAGGYDLYNVGDIFWEDGSSSTGTKAAQWGDSDGDGLFSLLNSGATGIDVGTVDTEEATIKSGFSAPATSLWANGKMHSQRRLPTPQFTRSANNPIFTASDASWSFSPAEVHWPTILPTDNLSDPLGDFYMYYSPHNSAGTAVAYADDPEGPWTDYSNNPIHSDAFEAGVFYHEDNGEVWVYENSASPENKELLLRRSADGLTNWIDDGVVFSTRGHAGYPKVFRTPQGVYHTSWQKWNETKANIVLRYSADGKTNWKWVQPTFHGSAPTGTGDTGTSTDFYHDGVTLLPFHGGYLGFWGRQDHANDQWDIHWGFTQDGITINDWGPVLEGGGQAWENNRVSEPEPVWYNGSLYLFYSGDTAGNQEIGVTVADFSEVI